MTNLLNVCTYNIPTTFNRYPVTDRGNVEWVTRIVMFVNLSFILDYLLPLSDKYTCVGWFSGKMLRPLTTQQRVRSLRDTFVNKRLSGLITIKHFILFRTRVTIG